MSFFRRTLLTASRTVPARTQTIAARTLTTRPTFALRTPLHNTTTRAHTRAFSVTMGKQGVHNLGAKADFDSAKAEKGTLMVLDCFATWCGPCKVIAPQVVKMSDTYPDARFYKLDVDELPEVAQELGIRAMPTFVLFKDGEKVGEVVGANPKALEAAIQQHL